MRRRNPSIALGFLALILLGAGLLNAPFARNAHEFGRFSDALFTACSAVCVTGLTIVDIAAEYTRIGQWILLVLVELGCLGLMTLGTFFIIAIGRRLSLTREFSLMNAYGVEQVQGLRGLIIWVVGLMVIVEGLGAVILNYHLHDWYLSFFYSVMSYCNAGFSILPGSLAIFADDPLVLMTLGAETILGGIGFLVIYNLCTFWNRRGRLSLHSSVMLRFTGYLLIAGFALFLLLEWDNTLKDFDWVKKVYLAFYHAITPRTCGFSVLPIEKLAPFTRLIYEAMMFLGGGPGSAAAGLKLTTFAVLIYTILAMCRGDRETIISKRVVAYDTVREAFVIFVALVALIIFTLGALLLTEHGEPNFSGERLLFEAISAITTTGLSCGDTTSSLSAGGRVVIMVAMFCGRLGALAVVMLIGEREVARHVRFPSGELVVG